MPTTANRAASESPRLMPHRAGGAVGVAGGVADAADRLAHRTEPGFGRPGAGLAEPGHVHEDHAGVAARQRFVVEPPVDEAPRPEVLDHHVARRGEVLDEPLARFGAQVGHDGALVAGDGRPPQAVAVEGHAPATHRVAALGRFDLDDLGAVVAQQLAGERPGDEAAQFEDADAREGAVGRSHGKVVYNFGTLRQSRGETSRMGLTAAP